MCLNSDLFFAVCYDWQDYIAGICPAFLFGILHVDHCEEKRMENVAWSEKKTLFVHPNVGIKWKGWQTGSTVTTALFDLEEERGFLWRTVAIYIVKTVFEVSKLLRIMEISKGICMTTFLRCDTLKLKIRLSYVCRHLSLGPCKLSGL